MLLGLLLISAGVVIGTTADVPFYNQTSSSSNSSSPAAAIGNSTRPQAFDPAQCPDKTNYTECLKRHLKSIGVTREPIPANTTAVRFGTGVFTSKGWGWPYGDEDTPANAPTFWENDDPPSFFVNEADNIKFEFMICDSYYYPDEQHIRRGGDCSYFAGEVARWSALHFSTPGTVALIGTCGLENNMMGLIDAEELDAMWWPPHAVLGKTKNGLCAYEMGFFWTNSMEMLKVYN